MDVCLTLRIQNMGCSLFYCTLYCIKIHGCNYMLQSRADILSCFSKLNCQNEASQRLDKEAVLKYCLKYL